MNVAQLWDICLKFEFDEEELFKGLKKYLKHFKDAQILDCACGTGFVTLDLIKEGYDITCSDGSEIMLEEFRKNAEEKGVEVEPHLLKWSELSKTFGDKFDLVMCRGCSLPYANSWDECRENSIDDVRQSVKNFYECLKPGGRLYVDMVNKKNLISKKPEENNYPALDYNGKKVELRERVTSDKKKKMRTWDSCVTVDGKEHISKRCSCYFDHEELLRFLEEVGFSKIKKLDMPPERYDVFEAQK